MHRFSGFLLGAIIAISFIITWFNLPNRDLVLFVSALFDKLALQEAQALNLNPLNLTIYFSIFCISLTATATHIIGIISLSLREVKKSKSSYVSDEIQVGKLSGIQLLFQFLIIIPFLATR